MKILHQQFAKITAGEFAGKIFQLNHYHQHLHVAYFPGPPEQLISINDLELISMPFPYWRTQGEGMIIFTEQPNSKRCDALPYGEQISLSAARVLKLKTHIKLHKDKLKKSRRNLSTGEESPDQLYRFLERERVIESKLSALLGNIIPISKPDKELLLKLEKDFITKNDIKPARANIANPVGEILQTTQPQEKLIFPPATKLKKKPGRPRGAKNVIPPSGWVEEKPNKDGTKSYVYRWNVCHWTKDGLDIPRGKLAEVQQLIKENYPIEQIKNYLLGSSTNAVC
ncbi:MAG: hypothetical protein AAGJ08_01800 [Cyanobacteria bacterium P01_H01_bin.35]